MTLDAATEAYVLDALDTMGLSPEDASAAVIAELSADAEAVFANG